MKTSSDIQFNIRYSGYGILGSGSYNPAVFMMGSLFEGSTGPTSYIGPKDVTISRMVDSGNWVSYPSVINWSDRYNWIFFSSAKTTAPTMEFYVATHDKYTNTTWVPGSTISGPWAYLKWTPQSMVGTTLNRALKAVYYKYTSGYAIMSGTIISGSNTQWYQAGIPGGTRIGFGSTIPGDVTRWETINAVNNDTKLTLNYNVGHSPGVPYVIEDLRLLFGTLNSTAAAGGFKMIKGINFNTFTGSAGPGVPINDFVTNDNSTGLYSLKDAATNTATQPIGIDVEDYQFVTSGSHLAYMANGITATSLKMYVFNIRTRMSGPAMASGSSSGSYVLQTDVTQLPTSSVPGNFQNLSIGTLNHGPASGTPSIFFTSNISATTSIYRAKLSNIVSGSTSWLTDFMPEVPPGGSTTFAQTNALAQARFSSSIDSLIVPTTSTPFRVYATKYQTDGRQFDNIFFQDTAQLNKVNSTGSTSNVVNPRGTGFLVDNSPDGWSYFIAPSINVGGAPAGSEGSGILYCVPLAADWNYQPDGNQYLITPEILTPNATKFYNVYTNKDSMALDINYLAIEANREPYRIFVRNSGISDNSGEWTPLGDDGDLTSLDPSDSIQFRIDFKIMGITGLPARIHNLSVVYEKETQEGHYQPSLTYSSSADRTFAWRQSGSWGSPVPNMYLRIYNDNLNKLIYQDTLYNPISGSWQYSTSGSTWYSFASGAQGDGYYLRYTSIGLPNNITIRALLTQVV